MGLLGAIELAVLPAGGLLAEQRRRETLLHERLAHPVHRGGPTRDRLGNPFIVPALPTFADIGLEQNAHVDQHGRRPLAGADEVIQLGPLFIGQTNNVFGQRHGQAPGRGDPSRKTRAT